MLAGPSMILVGRLPPSENPDHRSTDQQQCGDDPGPSVVLRIQDRSENTENAHQDHHFRKQDLAAGFGWRER